MSNYTFASSEMLLVRLHAAMKQGKKIAVLTGSGLTTPNLPKGEMGVSSTSDIVRDIRQVFVSHNEEVLFNSHVNQNLPAAEQYQSAMQTLLSCFGQDELNNVIIKAVLNSLSNKAIVTGNQSELNPEALEKEYKNWYLRPGVDALGELFVDFKEKFSGPILTSNFDPLLEISVRKHGGIPQSIFVVNDGKFLNQRSDNIQSIVHFHGYWHGSDTLHTIDQLKRDRPLLKGDLKKLLHNSVLLVIGYGGWNDVFTNTLLELIKEGNNNFDVLWTFYVNNEDDIEKNNSYILGQMANSIGQRVVLYKNVDVHYVFPTLLNILNSNSSTSSLSVQSNLIERVDEQKKEGKVLIEEAFVSDTPPNNLFWAGRKKELSLLAKDNYKTCVISGIGGQGKSGLASHFVRNFIEQDNSYEFWDWRDCKEEDNKVQAIIIQQIERLSKGHYRSSKIASENSEDLLELFFEIISNRRIVFVYDNIDNYIDLEKFEPVGGIGQLFELANSKSHNSKFIFTCRPHINCSYSNYMEIPLKELSLAETVELFKEYKPAFGEVELEEVAKESHSLSNGHALWLTLIGAQVRRGLSIVRDFLKNYQQNKVLQQSNTSYTLAQRTLDVVWKSLNLKQQTLLRGMGEMVTAFSKDELEDIFKSELSLNQFNKAFNTLNSMSLLVVKSTSGKKDLFELHPLVKEYIINKYKRAERSKFITLIVNFYDQIILWIKPKLDADSPLSYFEKYTQRAELQINNGDFKAALLSLHEVSNVIHAAGFSEEYLRVGSILFVSIDWLKAATEEYTYFHDEIYTFIHTLTEKGRFVDVEEYLKKYEMVIPGKSAQYLSYCNLNAYYYWFKDQFKHSIDWSEKGLRLQKQTGVGSTAEADRTLALSLRDTKEKENTERAISIFLQGENLNEVLEQSFSTENFSSEFFGNIGRCLWFMENPDDASICYFKSFQLLGEEKASNTMINLGYACLWIAEVALETKDERSALYFLKYCFLNWDKVAPIKSMNVRKKYEQIINEADNTHFLVTLSNWDVEKYCANYVEDNLARIYKRRLIEGVL